MKLLPENNENPRTTAEILPLPKIHSYVLSKAYCNLKWMSHSVISSVSSHKKTSDFLYSVLLAFVMFFFMHAAFIIITRFIVRQTEARNEWKKLQLAAMNTWKSCEHLSKNKKPQEWKWMKKVSQFESRACKEIIYRLVIDKLTALWFLDGFFFFFLFDYVCSGIVR